MALYGTDGKQPVTGQPAGPSELRSMSQLPEKLYPGTAETSVVLDPCAENQLCSRKGQMTSSTTTLQSCSCGPECQPSMCQEQGKTALVPWDNTKTKIFIFLSAAFALWLLIYIPISVGSMND